MVLINNLTIDEINAALLHLQRSSGEIVGGDKGRTVNNISVSNSGGGGMDYQSVINSLKERLTQIETTNTEQQTQINEILLTLGNLADNGIQDFDYDENSGELTITTKDGEEYTVVIRSPTSTLTFDATTKKLTFTFNDDVTEITLPYVASSEKGVANGVATLDSTGRIPYSQMPESAMEFKGEWNANTNTPHLQDGTGTNGDFYVCTVGGTVNFGTGGVTRNITFYPNDRVIYEGTSQQWFRLPAGEVRTVNGQSGDVVLDGEDINYSSASGSPTIKEKIDSVETKAETQSDWGQTNSSAIDYIKNKPNLATVATSGSYTDLSNKPTIPAAQIQSDWTQTDSTKKDFIKNKIPIWITTGSADDNMSPIDSVTNGNMRPVTSNAVYDAVSQITETNIIYDTSITNCNNMYQKGKLVTYCANRTEVTNLPNTDHDWYIIAQCNPTSWSPNNYVTQIATSGGYLNSNDTYTRHGYLSGSTIIWTSWKKLLTATDKYQYINTKQLTSAGWYKIATLGGRAYGATISIDLFTTYQYQRNCCHNIKVNYGWVSSSVKDFAKDLDTVFDKIRICFNANNEDQMAIYVHYKPTQANPCYVNIQSGATALVPVNFETDSLTWGTTQEFNLGTDGLYENGNKVITSTSYNDSTIVDITSQLTRFLGAGSVYARRMNNMVYININGAYTGNPTTATQQFIQNLPDKYRPSQTLESFILLGYNATQFVTCARARVTSNGNIEMAETSWATGTQIRAGLIYFVD